MEPSAQQRLHLPTPPVVGVRVGMLLRVSVCVCSDTTLCVSRPPHATTPTTVLVPLPGAPTLASPRRCAWWHAQERRVGWVGVGTARVRVPPHRSDPCLHSLRRRVTVTVTTAAATAGVVAGEVETGVTCHTSVSVPTTTSDTE